MTTREENRGVVGGNNLRDGDQGMQVVWDQLDHHLVAIAALEGRMQTGFGDINARFDDLSTRLKALRLHTNMNWEKREEMMLATNLSLNRFMQILVVNMNTGIHLMKKIKVRWLKIIGMIKTIV